MNKTDIRIQGYFNLWQRASKECDEARKAANELLQVALSVVRPEGRGKILAGWQEKYPWLKGEE